MIAYNRHWLDVLWLKDAAQAWHERGLIADEKWKALEGAHSAAFYSPNLFVRIGLAIFCFILLLAGMGLMGLILSPNSTEGFALFCIFCGLGSLAVLELWAIRSARHFGSGIDDMLLYVGVAAVITGLCACLPYSVGTLAYCCMAAPFLIAGSIRYLDRLMGAGAFCCLLLMVLLTVNKLPGLARYLLPFSGMLFAAGAVFFARNGQGRYDWRHWHTVLVVVELLGLVTFYASGNYWVIQQFGEDLFSLAQPPLGWFFWACTFLVPVLYIFWGIRGKERLLLDIGLVGVVAALCTFRFYFHVLPLAWASTLGGAVLFASAYFLIKYFQKNATFYTYEAEGDTSLLQTAGEHIVEQTTANQTAPAPVRKETLGGGQFGGGGAEGGF